MYVSYDRYRIFYYVAKYGNISQAAKVLLSNQPNLTRIIKNLEGELGCTLFARTSRGMKLTPEGQRLYDHVRIAVEHIEAGEAEINENRSLHRGTIFVAASEVALRCLLLPVLKKYRTLYPGVHIRISNHSTPQAIAALKDGTADIAVVTTPTAHSASLVETKVKTITEVAVCSPFFSALTNRPVSLEELLTYPLISLGTDTSSFIPKFSPATVCPISRISRPLPPIRFCPWWRRIWAWASFPGIFCGRTAPYARLPSKKKSRSEAWC